VSQRSIDACCGWHRDRFAFARQPTRVQRAATALLVPSRRTATISATAHRACVLPICPSMNQKRLLRVFLRYTELRAGGRDGNAQLCYDVAPFATALASTRWCAIGLSATNAHRFRIHRLISSAGLHPPWSSLVFTGLHWPSLVTSLDAYVTMAGCDTLANCDSKTIGPQRS
jgi:hypothetical protein